MNNYRHLCGRELGPWTSGISASELFSLLEDQSLLGTERFKSFELKIFMQIEAKKFRRILAKFLNFSRIEQFKTFRGLRLSIWTPNLCDSQTLTLPNRNFRLEQKTFRNAAKFNFQMSCQLMVQSNLSFEIQFWTSGGWNNELEVHRVEFVTFFPGKSLIHFDTFSGKRSSKLGDARRRHPVRS